MNFSIRSVFSRLAFWLLMFILSFSSANAKNTPIATKKKQAKLHLVEAIEVQPSENAITQKWFERVEAILSKDKDIDALFTTVGGFVFGRSQFERSNRTSIKVVLKPAKERSAALTIGSNTPKRRSRKPNWLA